MCGCDRICYIPLGFHSYFSLLHGALSPEEICRYASFKGYRAAGIADINNLYGAVRFVKAAKKEGVIPVVGASVYQKKKQLFKAFIINGEGFAMLNRIITAVLDRDNNKYDAVESLTETGWNGLILLSDNTYVIEKLTRHSKENLYVMLTYGKAFASLLRFAEENNLPSVALQDIFYAEQHENKLYNILRAVDLNVTVNELPESEIAKASYGAVSDKEIKSYFSAFPQALTETCRIAEKTGGYGSLGIIHKSYVFPKFNGLAEEESFYLLKQLCYRGIAERYPHLSGSKGIKVIKRLNHELLIIKQKGFSGYFLVVHSIVSRYPRTCGRGSSASSIVSYLLGITHVDPIRYNLFFERFLNEARKDPPDIDVDFPWDERPKTLKYIFNRYRGKSGIVADHVTFGPRSSLREPAKAMGIEEEEIKRLVRFLRLGEKERIPRYLLAVAERMRGFPHYIGTHPGGVVITPKAIISYTHVQISPLGYPVIAWDKDSAETAGLVKIDILGNRSLGVLRDTIRLVNRRLTSKTAAQPAVQMAKQTLAWARLNPINSAETEEMISHGSTIGIFYVESPATRQLLRKMEKGDFENLVIASSIIRPAANRYVKLFVERLHGKPYKPLHPLVEKTLKETFGIMVYQEDVSRIAIDLAGFSPGEADQLRKTVTKKNRTTRLRSFKELFFNRGRKGGVKQKVLKSIWDMILSFDGYSFCKAHSASYAFVSYKLAYLKRFYPLEFIASVINNGGGYYTTQTYINECRRMGFPILKPDINRSGYLYRPEYSGSSVCAEDPDKRGALRVGLIQLKGIRREFLFKLIDERKQGGVFKDFTDFVKRITPGASELAVLIKSGSLDSVSSGYTRPELFWRHYNAVHFDGSFIFPAIPPMVGNYSESLKIKHEYETLGLYISRHPLKIFSEQVEGAFKRIKFNGKSNRINRINSSRIPHYVNREIAIAGLLVTGKEVITRNRERMVFVSFEDTYSVFETILFPEVFKKFRRILDTGGIYVISGRVDIEMGAYSINVNEITEVYTSGTIHGYIEKGGLIFRRCAV